MQRPQTNSPVKGTSSKEFQSMPEGDGDFSTNTGTHKADNSDSFYARIVKESGNGSSQQEDVTNSGKQEVSTNSQDTNKAKATDIDSNASEVVPTNTRKKKIFSTDLDTIETEQFSSPDNSDDTKTQDKPVPNFSVGNNSVKDIFVEERTNLSQEIPSSFSKIPNDMLTGTDQLICQNSQDNSTPAPNEQQAETGANTDDAAGSESGIDKVKENKEACSNVICSDVDSKSTEKVFKDISSTTMSTTMSTARSQTGNHQDNAINPTKKETDDTATDMNSKITTYPNSQGVDGIMASLDNAGSVSSEDASRECQSKERFSTVADIVPVEQSSSQQSSEVQNVAIFSDSKETSVQDLSIEGDENTTITVASNGDPSINTTQQSHDNLQYVSTVPNLQQPLMNGDTSNIHVVKDAAIDDLKTGVDDTSAAAVNQSKVESEKEEDTHIPCTSLLTTDNIVADNNDDVHYEHRIVPISTAQSKDQKHGEAVLDKPKDNANATTAVYQDPSSIKVTHNRHAFQQYLKRKNLCYQASQTRVSQSKYSLENCLTMHTSLDVLDENNKFICQHCTEQKQSKFASLLYGL